MSEVPSSKSSTPSSLGGEAGHWAAMLPSASCRAKLRPSPAAAAANSGDSASSTSSDDDEEEDKCEGHTQVAVVRNQFATLGDENAKQSHSKKDLRGVSPPSLGTPTEPAKRPKQVYDFFLVLDFEATCEENEFHYDHEIIEFPVVVVDAARNAVVGEFHSFVKPKRNRGKLTKFCTELTGITQQQVDDAPVLETVLENFSSWFKSNVPEAARCVFVTDGPWDMREFMFRHSVVRDGVEFPRMFYTYIDLRHTFANIMRCKPRGVQAMLAKFSLVFEGRQHSGIDDTRNIARILMKIIRRGHKFDNVSKVQEDRVRLDMEALMKKNGLDVQGEGNVKRGPIHGVGGGGARTSKGGTSNGAQHRKGKSNVTTITSSPKTGSSHGSSKQGPQFPATPFNAAITSTANGGAGRSRGRVDEKKEKKPVTASKAAKKAQARAKEFDSD